MGSIILSPYFANKPLQGEIREGIEVKMAGLKAEGPLSI
jgi:hypothetical protein